MELDEIKRAIDTKATVWLPWWGVLKDVTIDSLYTVGVAAVKDTESRFEAHVAFERLFLDKITAAESILSEIERIEKDITDRYKKEQEGFDKQRKKLHALIKKELKVRQ